MRIERSVPMYLGLVGVLVLAAAALVLHERAGTIRCYGLASKYLSIATTTSRGR